MFTVKWENVAKMVGATSSKSFF